MQGRKKRVTGGRKIYEMRRKDRIVRGKEGGRKGKK